MTGVGKKLPWTRADVCVGVNEESEGRLNKALGEENGNCHRHKREITIMSTSVKQAFILCWNVGGAPVHTTYSGIIRIMLCYFRRLE